MEGVRHITRTVCGGVILIVAAILLIANGANASATGYFYSGSYGDGGTSVLPKDYNDKIDDGTTGNIAIPLSVNNVATFMEFLKDKNGIRGQERTGSAYIVCTMLGQDFSGCKSNGYISIDQIISSIGYYELESRLNSTDLTIDWNINFAQKTLSSFTNTLYDTDTADIYRWLQPDAEIFHLIYFRQKGVLLYRLARDCANPIGTLSSIPPVKTWDIQPTTTVAGTPRPGNKITWTHKLINNGPGTTTNIKYHYQNRPDLGNTSGPDNSFIFPDQQTKQFESYHTVTQDDSDNSRQLCRSTSAQPKSNSDSGWIESAAACVDAIPNNWSVSVSSAFDKPIAKPGDTITWTHTVTNNGPDATDKVISYYYQNSGYFGSGQGTSYSLPKYFSGESIQKFESTYSVTQNDVGNDNLCRSTTAQPRAWNNSGAIGSATTCAKVPYQYTLTPFVNTDSGGVVEAGASFIVSPTVTNTGPTKSKDTQWQLTRIIVNSGLAVPNSYGGNSLSSPCGTYFKATGAMCKTVESGTTVFDADGSYMSGDALPNYSTNSDDYVAGTKICFAFSVQPRADNDTKWGHSAPVCLVVGKKPKVQIWGGDLWVGKSVDTSISVKSSNTFGSWDEYGIFATGSISGMASGAAFAGSGLANSYVCGYSTLSFTNVHVGETSCTGVAGSIGNYSNSHSIPDVAASFPVDGSTQNVTPNLNNLQGIFTASSNVVTIISGGNIQKGQWIVVNASNADITITGDIKYTIGQLHGITDIPQVVIIANNINIADNVTNIDAWLIAKTSINTCSSSAPPLTINMCNQPLTVNGPVMTGKLYLRRTAGSGLGAATSPDHVEHSGDPAEVFNLRPDAYLWAAARTQSTGRVQTVYVTELPPRF